MEIKDLLTIVASFVGAVLGGVLTALIVERFRQRARSEAYAFELFKHKIEAYQEIAAALDTLGPESDGKVFMAVVARRLAIIDATVSRWLDVIGLAYVGSVDFDFFLQCLQHLDAPQAQDLANFARAWRHDKLKKMMVLMLHGHAINAMRKDLRLAALQITANDVFHPLEQVQRERSE